MFVDKIYQSPFCQEDTEDEPENDFSEDETMDLGGEEEWSDEV